jgi:anti-sigma factor RsiW
MALVADGEASPSERLQVSQHTGRCTRCQILLAREQRLSEALEELAHIDDKALERLIEGKRDGSPPLGFSARLMKEIEKPSTKKRFRRGLRLATPFWLAGWVLLALGVRRALGFIATQEQSFAGAEAIALCAGRLGSLLQIAWELIGL